MLHVILPPGRQGDRPALVQPLERLPRLSLVQVDPGQQNLDGAEHPVGAVQ